MWKETGRSVFSVKGKYQILPTTSADHSIASFTLVPNSFLGFQIWIVNEKSKRTKFLYYWITIFNSINETLCGCTHHMIIGKIAET